MPRLKKELEDKSTVFSEIDKGNFIDNEDNIIINNEIYDIKDIINQIENNEKIPFVRAFNEVYMMLFFLALKEIEDDGLYEEIKNNLKIFIEYFQIETYKTYKEFKQKYIDINKDQISYEIISIEFSEINKSEYTCKYILASYKVLINKVFSDPSFVYINLLLFLQKFISEENKLLKKIIENEVNSNLQLSIKENPKDSKENIRKSLILKKYKYSYEFNDIVAQNPNNYQNQFINYNNNYEQNNYQNQFINYNNNYQQNQQNNKFINYNNNYQQNNYQDIYNNQQQNYIYQPKKY